VTGFGSSYFPTPATKKREELPVKNKSGLTWQSALLHLWRFRNFSFYYPSITSTGIVRAYDSLKTDKRFKEKRRKKKDQKKKGENWRKKNRGRSKLEKIEEIHRKLEKMFEEGSGRI
jgi:hypothetical protein